ncbi:unnamed protein product, partial [Meganyctiphanes norvegica]
PVSHQNWLSKLRARTAAALERRKKEDDNVETSLHPDINRVEHVQWYCKENAKDHHTSDYKLTVDKQSPQAVLRRGQSFGVGIKFKDRDFNIEQDRVLLNFEFGTQPSIQKGTLGVIQVENDNFTCTEDKWDVKIEQESTGKDLILRVFAPASVPVGRWSLKIKTGLQDHSVTKSMSEYTADNEAYILFNPFCKEDLVYMEDETDREEYVMNANGKVFMLKRAKPWAFGQFEDVVLPVAVYILDLCRITDAERGNPIPVVRAITAGANHLDNDGILEGNWTGEYSGGVAPRKWISSVSIIEKYVQNGFRPVKYGQCWVFSAIVTTICRALGIPCRSVTNYVSAHDTNKSLTLDKFFTKEGVELEEGPDGSYDSVWNFHVWNDVWMARPDLPNGYGGWQAIDGTPQEKSDDLSQCGPASLEAIRQGDIGLGFDGGFIFSEVNADVINWIEDEDSPSGWKSTKTMKYHVGRKILTKKPGKDDDWEDTENIIDQYKNKEHTAAERLAIHNAIRGIKPAPYFDVGKVECKEDVSFDLTDIDKIQIGDNCVVKLNVKNNSNEPRSIMASLTTKSVYYTGVNHEMIKKIDGKFVLQPQETKEIVLDVKHAEYWNKLVEGCMVKMYMICHIEETGQTFVDEDDFVIEKPKLEIKVSEELKVGEVCQAVLTFKNPLNMPLTNCEVTVVGPGLMKDQHIKIAEPVPAEGVFSHQIQIKPCIPGEKRKIIAEFDARELFDIIGSKSVTAIE